MARIYFIYANTHFPDGKVGEHFRTFFEKSWFPAPSGVLRKFIEEIESSHPGATVIVKQFNRV